MIGQSNMAGRDGFNKVEQINNPICFMLRCGKWVPMSDPVNPDRGIEGEFPSGISLAPSFADEYAKTIGNDTGLIPCAYGGTGILEWQPSELLFDHAVMMTKLAQRTSELKGIIQMNCPKSSIPDGAFYTNGGFCITHLSGMLNGEETAFDFVAEGVHFTGISTGMVAYRKGDKAIATKGSTLFAEGKEITLEYQGGIL